MLTINIELKLMPFILGVCLILEWLNRQWIINEFDSSYLWVFIGFIIFCNLLLFFSIMRKMRFYQEVILLNEILISAIIIY